VESSKEQGGEGIKGVIWEEKIRSYAAMGERATVTYRSLSEESLGTPKEGYNDQSIDICPDAVRAV